MTAEWDGTELPLKDGDAAPEEACHIADGGAMDDAVSHVKKILDNKHQKADLSKVCHSHAELSTEQQGQLEMLLMNTIGNVKK